MINKILEKMIMFSEGNQKKEDIAHFLKVYSYARLIGELENIGKDKQEILEITAIVHDIACPYCRIKYGNSQGKYQEIEGPAIVRDFLKEFDLDEKIVDRVAYLVGHHHTYDKVDGIDYQILLEADFLVNGDEMNVSLKGIENMKKNVFKTESGIRLLNAIYDL